MSDATNHDVHHWSLITNDAVVLQCRPLIIKLYQYDYEYCRLCLRVASSSHLTWKQSTLYSWEYDKELQI